MTRWEYLVYHCTGGTKNPVPGQIIGEWASPGSIWHQHVVINRWKDWGYNFMISNPYPTYEDWKLGRKWDILDGSIIPLRTLDLDPVSEFSEIGAHVKGWNSKAIGVVLVGNTHFTMRQLLAAKNLFLEIREKVNPNIIVKGHYELDGGKTCPNIDMDVMRAWFQGDGSALSILCEKHSFPMEDGVPA